MTTNRHQMTIKTVMTQKKQQQHRALRPKTTARSLKTKTTKRQKRNYATDAKIAK